MFGVQLQWVDMYIQTISVPEYTCDYWLLFRLYCARSSFINCSAIVLFASALLTTPPAQLREYVTLQQKSPSLGLVAYNAVVIAQQFVLQCFNLTPIVFAYIIAVSLIWLGFMVM